MTITPRIGLPIRGGAFGRLYCLPPKRPPRVARVGAAPRMARGAA
jgi:hypothetical protein